jgi:hypothetical protein
MPNFKKKSIAEVKELRIPYANKKVKELYDDALSSHRKKERDSCFGLLLPSRQC